MTNMHRDCTYTREAACNGVIKQSGSTGATHRKAIDLPVTKGDGNEVEEHAAQCRDCEEEPEGAPPLPRIVHLRQDGLHARHHQRQAHPVQRCPCRSLHKEPTREHTHAANTRHQAVASLPGIVHLKP